MRLELAEEKNRSEQGPVDGLPRGWVQNACGGASTRVVRIGINEPSRLREVGRVEHCFDQESAAPKRRLSAELFEDQLLDRVVEQAPASADARLTRRTRAPSNTKPRSECFVVGLG